MFNAMTPDVTETKEEPKKIETLSECCSFSCSMSTDDDFTKVCVEDKNTWAMSIRFICNKCGKECKVKDVVVE